MQNECCEPTWMDARHMPADSRLMTTEMLQRIANNRKMPASVQIALRPATAPAELAVMMNVATREFAPKAQLTFSPTNVEPSSGGGGGGRLVPEEEMIEDDPTEDPRIIEEDAPDNGNDD